MAFIRFFEKCSASSEPSVGKLSIVISYDVLIIDGEMDDSTEDIRWHISTSHGLGIPYKMNKVKKIKNIVRRRSLLSRFFLVHLLQMSLKPISRSCTKHGAQSS